MTNKPVVDTLVWLGNIDDAIEAYEEHLKDKYLHDIDDDL
jgi:hypothetical protein